MSKSSLGDDPTPKEQVELSTQMGHSVGASRAYKRKIKV
jgi:hypothetical protein